VYQYSVSVKGGESFTTKPFDAAAGRMAEDGDRLVFHTSRERYTTSDGLNHQSQLTLIVDTGAMKVLNDLGPFQSNHVSHSFDQYVLIDGQGNPTSGIEILKGFKLSKGQPVVRGNKVTWYVDKKGVRTFYTIPL